MQSHKGRLQELGQATVHNRTRYSFNNYSYIQVGDELIKNIACWRGLDGKLQQQLGEEITLHTKNGFVVAIEASDGKTYSGERTGGDVWVFAAGVLLSTCILGAGGSMHSKLASFFSLAIAVGLMYVSYQIYKYMDASSNEGADLPNAIRIPKA